METANTTAALALWEHVFGDERGILQVWTGVRGPDGRIPRETVRETFYNYPGAAEAAAEWALERSEEGREVYFCAHLLTDAQRGKDYAAAVLTTWADLDGADVPNGPLTPTAVVETSPGHFQTFWRLTDPIPPRIAEALNRRLAREIGADPSGFDLTQLLRVPDTINYKYPKHPVVRARNIDDARAYAPADLDEILPELKQPQADPEPEGPTEEEPPVVLDAESLKVWRGQQPKLKDDGRINRSASLVKIGRVLYDARATRPAIVAALAERDKTLGWCKYTDRHDAELRYQEIVDELEKSGRSGSARLVSSSGRNGGGEYRHTPTDQGNAERLVDDHGQDVCYCHQSRTWHVFDGQRWKADTSGEVVRRTKRTARGIFIEAANAPSDGKAKALGAWAKQSLSEARIRATMELAKSEPEIAVTSDQLDADAWLLNVANGTIDLRTGELREHRREDLLTKLAPVEYDPEAPAPTFERFLERILPSEALRRFLQRAVGYSLTADTRERILLILYGTGRNGKSTLLEIIREVMGDYAMKTPAETLLAKPAGGVPNDIARLKGARFVSASETEANRRLAEALVKEITGQDTISARFMRAEWFDFRPSHKTWLATNHKPTIRGTDPAIWDRIRLIPFGVRIPDEEVDRELPAKLRAELPGILAWAVRGCLDWRDEGLGEPAEVQSATEGYRAEMDVLAAFLDERCGIFPNVEAQASPLYRAYREWCEEAGEKPESQRGFGMRLTERGFERKKSNGVYWWLGICLSEGP